MSGRIILTIDDSPSPGTPALAEFLLTHDMPAVLFCRGDNLELFPVQAQEALARGFTLANHAYNHRRASVISYEEMTAEILATEKLIDDVYKSMRRPRGAKYFRFPHMDRGCGGWVVDYDAAPAHAAALRHLFADGLNVKLDPPTAEHKEKKAQLQEFLRAEGFAPLPAAGVTHKAFRETEMAAAVDAMFTFSTADWMLTRRHLGKWPYKTLADLKKKIDQDPWLAAAASENIVLAHDQPELLPVVKTLVAYLREKGFYGRPV